VGRGADRSLVVRVVAAYQQPLAGYLWALGVARESLDALLVDTFVTAAEQRVERKSLYASATRLAMQHGVPLARCLLVLCCLEGFDYTEVAQMLDLSSAAVRATVRREKRRLA
jgi:DNA-directed RNA polymerase specialized sigma24 family protein